MTNAALDAVEQILGRRISTSTLHGWLAKSDPKSESKTEREKPKTETVISKPAAALSVSDEEREDDLDPQRLAFVDAYLGEARFDGKQAAIMAGYSPASAHVQASRLLKNVKVAAEIRRRLEPAALTSEQVLANTSDMANSTLEDFLTIPGVWPYIDLLKARERGKLHLVKKFKAQNDGSIVLELWDKRGPNRDMGEFHGLWKRGVQININVELVVQLVEALRAAGMDEVAMFERMIQKAHEKAQQNVNERSGNRPD